MSVSVIIPVYNSGKYLADCLNSLKNQKEIQEIILVENNSTDDSLSICQEFQKNNPKIHILNFKPWGAAAARNYGLKHAKGDFIWFVDSDDYVKKDALAILLKKQKETDADIVMVTAKYVYEDGKPEAILPAVKEKGWKENLIRFGAGPWHFLMRRKWLLENNLLFPEGIIHEDMALMSTFVLHTEKFASVSEPVYFYRQHENSVLHQPKWNPHFADIFPALNFMSADFKKYDAEEKYHDELENFYIWNLLSDSARDFMRFKEGKKYLKDMRKVLKTKYPKWWKNKYFRKKPFPVRLRCYLNYLGVKK